MNSLRKAVKVFPYFVGVDEYLAMHYAHLFIRDPLVIFEELLHQDNSASSDHFENIQSTNWQTMRFKPPPPNSNIGWRVEFRSMEIQLTDTENAAFATFVVLLTRTILKYNLNFYIPLSMVIYIILSYNRWMKICKGLKLETLLEPNPFGSVEKF